MQLTHLNRQNRTKDTGWKPQKTPSGGYSNPPEIYSQLDTPQTIENIPDVLHSPVTSPVQANTQNRKKSDGIDDFLVVDFSLEKFNDLQFTIKKNITLFFQDTFPYFVQSMFVPVFHIIYRIFFDLHIHGKENLKHKKGPMLFISNHIGIYDSFMFDMFVPPFSKILPFRFMGSRVFIVPILAVLKLIGVVDLIYLLFGVFKVTPGEGAEKSLKKAYEIVKHGGTVAMYPEGRIWHPTNVHPEPIGPFKWGAAILAKNTGVQVIPVSMKKTVKDGSMRPRIDIQIGKAFFTDRSKKPEQIAEDMRDEVVRLYKK